jgi:hypothetical protein
VISEVHDGSRIAGVSNRCTDHSLESEMMSECKHEKGERGDCFEIRMVSTPRSGTRDWLLDFPSFQL